MNLICYPLMGTKSKRLMVKRFNKKRSQDGKIYHYEPKRDLISRLAEELNMSKLAVKEQIYKERLFLLRETWNDPTITRADV